MKYEFIRGYFDSTMNYNAQALFDMLRFKSEPKSSHKNKIEPKPFVKLEFHEEGLLSLLTQEQLE